MKIETASDLRALLSETLTAVMEGRMDSQDANTIVRVSQQMNESLYAEIKVARVRHELAGEKLPAHGAMRLTDSASVD